MILLIQNNGDKRIWVMQNVDPAETNHLWIKFEDFDFPDDVPDGEYTYALIAGYEVKYQLKAEMLDTSINGKPLREWHPTIGLLRIGQPENKDRYTYEPEKNEQGQNNKQYYYYSK